MDFQRTPDVHIRGRLAVLVEAVSATVYRYIGGRQQCYSSGLIELLARVDRNYVLGDSETYWQV